MHVADLQDLLQNLMDLLLVAAEPGFQACVLRLLFFVESVNPAAGCFRLLRLLLLWYVPPLSVMVDLCTLSFLTHAPGHSGAVKVSWLT